MDELIRKKDAIDAVFSEPLYKSGMKKRYADVVVPAIYEKIKSLPPVQPTQTNCEYCHTDRDGYVFPLEKNSHAFIDRDKIVLKANGWRGEAKIKYCPICGRRLTDG